MFLKDKIGGSKEGGAQIVDPDSIKELCFDFDLPYDISSSTILNDMVNLKSLQSVFLKTNYLQSIPIQLSKKSLRKWYLFFAYIRLFSARIKKLSSLALPFNQVKYVGPEVGMLAGLTALDLSNNQIAALPKGKKIPIFFISLTSLFFFRIRKVASFEIIKFEQQLFGFIATEYRLADKSESVESEF